MLAAGERLGFYDGERWEFLPSAKSQGIRCLLVDGQTLWAASKGEIRRLQLPLNHQSREEPLEIPELADAGIFWHLEKSGDTLVATTAEDVWIINPATKEVRRQSLPTKSRLFLIPNGDSPIIRQPGVGLWELKEGRLQVLVNPLPDKSDLYWIWRSDDLILTNRALYRKTADGYGVVVDLKILDKAVISSATPWGRLLVVTTITKGLALVDPEAGRFTWVTRTSGLPTLYTSFAFTDRSDRLWVGSSQGIIQFESLRFGHRLSPTDSPLSAIRLGGLLINYEDRSEFFHDDGEIESLPHAFTLKQTRHGLALGLFSKLRVGPKEFPTRGNRVGAIGELPSGNLLAAVDQRLYFIDYESGHSELVKTPSSEFSGLTVIGDTLWAINVDGTLYRSGTAPPFVFAKVSSAPAITNATLHQLGQTLVIASPDSVRYGEQFREVAGAAGSRNPKLAATADGVLWLLGTQDGHPRLGRLLTAGTTIAWETVEAKGLAQLTDVRSLTASGDLLTICGDTCILELHAGELKPAYRLAPPRLSFSYSDPATDAPANPAAPPTRLTAEKNSFSFSGSLPFDEFGERPRFERRLLPTETAWIPASAGEKISYPSLSRRTYTLETRTTHLGHTGDVASYSFEVLPPWYASPLAIVGYVALAGLSSFLIYRLRTHQIRQRTILLERTVEERTHALAEASAAKTEFLASMSHEIRNPMNGVIGLVTILREQPATPRQEHNLRLLHSCAEQLRSTVDDILDFSKIEAGHITLESIPFDLRDTLEAAAATVDPAGAQIKFLEKLPANIALRGDAAKLRQIFANYASNALKYGVPPEARVSSILTAVAGGVRLTLSVTSSGPTIAKDTLDKFCDSFTRGTEAMERNIHGTGLGLAICKRYAEAMGGEVGAVSANGETTFYLNVPFAKESTVAIAAAATTPHPTLPARALAIEDEDYNRIVLGSILAKMNYTVDWATTGQEALRLARENGYDVILTDYRLPDTNGVDLTKEILRFCPDPKPAVFAVTAYSTRERRDECLRAGMAGFISKPITLEKLRATLTNWGENQLTKISLETMRRPDPVLTPELPTEITAAWAEVKCTAAADGKKAAALAHHLNNLARSFDLIDFAEQLELLEGALERGEPAGKFLEAAERLLRPDSVDLPS